jgi:Domain of unknown function (DUF5122) beta-propeller
MRHNDLVTAGVPSRHRVLVLASVVSIVAALIGVRPALGLTQLPDTTWKVRGKVFALAEGSVGGTPYVYIGGKFERASEQDGGHPYAAASLTRFTLDGVGDPSFLPNVSQDEAGTINATVLALALSADGSVLYLGGKFSYVNGVAHKNLAAVSTADGSVLPGFDPVVGSTVNTILPEAGGSRVFIGGAFKNVNSLTTPRLAALDATTGAADPTWTPAADSTVRSLRYAADGATMFVTGHFTTMNGQPRQSVARLNPDGTLNAWVPQAGFIPTPMNCWDVTASLTVVYLGCGAGPNFDIAFSLTSGTVGTKLWKHGTPGNVEAVALTPDGTGLVAGGHFGTNFGTNTICGGTMELHGISVQDVATGEFGCWAPHIYPDHSNAKGVWTVLVDSQGHVWSGGWFTKVCFPDESLPANCVPQQGVARYTL